MKTSLWILAAVLCLGGCEFTNNPLLVEGAFVNAAFRVDQEGLPPNSPFGASTTMRLGDVLEDISDVADSVKIYNISITVDSVTGSTSPASTISGSASIDGHSLFTLSNVPLSALSPEHSIFDTSVPGCGFSSAGVQYLVQALRQNPPPTVTVTVFGNSSSTALHFSLRLKVYTQIYTTP